MIGQKEIASPSQPIDVRVRQMRRGRSRFSKLHAVYGAPLPLSSHRFLMIFNTLASLADLIFLVFTILIWKALQPSLNQRRTLATLTYVLPRVHTSDVESAKWKHAVITNAPKTQGLRNIMLHKPSFRYVFYCRCSGRLLRVPFRTLGMCTVAAVEIWLLVEARHNYHDWKLI